MDWYSRAKRFGVWQASLSTVLRNLDKYLNFHFWTIQTRSPEPDYVPPEEHNNTIEFRKLTLEETLAAAHDPELGLTEKFVRCAFARDDICTGALLKGTLVAYSWKTLTRAPVSNRLWIRIDRQPQFYGYKAFVLPQFRGKRLSPSVARASDKHLVSAGAKWGVSYIAVSNLESRQANFRTESRVLRGYAGYWRIGDFYWTFRTKGAKPFIEFEHSATNISI